MNFKITIRRRNPDGSLETATYNLEHVHSSGDDEQQLKLLLDMEQQANGADPGGGVRVWVEEKSE